MRGAVDRARARAVERRRCAVDAFAQARGASRRCAVLARQPRNPVHEYVGASNAAACLAVQRGALGLVGHTHVAGAWRGTPGGASAVKITVGVPLDLTGGKWLLNPGAVGAPAASRVGWWDGLDLEAGDGAYWLLLDLQGQRATWRRAPCEPAPARVRARALGLEGAEGSRSDPQRRATGSARR